LIRVSSRRGLVRCHCRRALRRHDQLPAAPALEPDRDADGQSVDLEAHAPGHYLLVRQLRDEAADSGGVQRHGDAVGRHIDPLDQEPEDARLLGRVELFRDRLERAQRLDDLAFLRHKVISRAVLSAHRGDGPAVA
jgi:hypothetical protein